MPAKVLFPHQAPEHVVLERLHSQLGVGDGAGGGVDPAPGVHTAGRADGVVVGIAVLHLAPFGGDVARHPAHAVVVGLLAKAQRVRVRDALAQRVVLVHVEGAATVAVDRAVDAHEAVVEVVGVVGDAPDLVGRLAQVAEDVVGLVDGH
ncbi:hypothetical protein D3C86_1629320 [compost metagenome]